VSGSKYQLKCAKLELNDIEVVQRLIQALAAIISDAKAWHRLEVYRGCYFQTPDLPLPIDPGWYVICDGQRTPLYVGQGNNLHSRLNPGADRSIILHIQQETLMRKGISSKRCAR